MDRDLTKGPVTSSMLLFALPMIFCVVVSALIFAFADPLMAVFVGIWWSVPIGWFLADTVGLVYYFKKVRGSSV